MDFLNTFFFLKHAVTFVVSVCVLFLMKIEIEYRKILIFSSWNSLFNTWCTLDICHSACCSLKAYSGIEGALKCLKILIFCIMCSSALRSTFNQKNNSGFFLFCFLFVCFWFVFFFQLNYYAEITLMWNESNL